jgi:NAD(P)-dependent dehydrogenase (short-subunit alcohol dehydrogenase family)
MVEPRRGALINTSSSAGCQALPYNAGYCAAKGQVLLLAEAAHAEVKEYGVTVTVVCPGPLPSGFGQASDGGYFAERLPKFRFVSAERIAQDALEARTREDLGDPRRSTRQGGARPDPQAAALARPAAKKRPLLGGLEPRPGTDIDTAPRAPQRDAARSHRALVSIVNRRAVIEAEDEIQAMIARLRSPEPVAATGMAMAERIHGPPRSLISVLIRATTRGSTGSPDRKGEAVLQRRPDRVRGRRRKSARPGPGLPVLFKHPPP